MAVLEEVPTNKLEKITDESIVCLSREKADDYVRISVQTKDLKRKETVCQEVNEDEK